MTHEHLHKLTLVEGERLISYSYYICTWRMVCNTGVESLPYLTESQPEWCTTYITRTSFLHSWNVSAGLGNVMATWRGLLKGILLNPNHRLYSEDTQVPPTFYTPASTPGQDIRLVMIARNRCQCPERTPFNECHVVQHVPVWSVSLKHKSMEGYIPHAWDPWTIDHLAASNLNWSCNHGNTTLLPWQQHLRSYKNGNM